MVKQVRVFIKGDVIGVGFRAWTKIQAKYIGVMGWVRNVYNKPDIFGPHGGVEGAFQGEEDLVLAMIAKVKEGSPIAIVDDVEIFWEAPKKLFETFEIVT